MTIGNAIKEYRLRQGMTQLDLAIRINKSARTVMRYEKGEIVPTPKVIAQIFNRNIEEQLYKQLTGVS